MGITKQNNFWVDSHAITVSHNRLTGTKRITFDGTEIMKTPRQLFEVENTITFTVNGSAYALSTRPKAGLKGDFEYDVRIAEEDDFVGEGLLGSDRCSVEGFGSLERPSN